MIPLIVFQKNIVFGPVELDEVAFQHQRLKFAVGEDILEVLYIAHHFPDLFLVVLVGAKILAHPVFQSLGLADIDNLPGFVVHNVDTRVQGQAHGFGPELFDVLCFFFVLRSGGRLGMDAHGSASFLEKQKHRQPAV